MSTDLLAATEARSSPIDLRRWPALARPKPAPGRAAAARALMQRIAARTGIHIRLADGRSFGPADRSCPRRRRPLGLLHPARAGRQDRIR